MKRKIFEKYGVAAGAVGGVAVIGVLLYALSQAATVPTIYVSPPSQQVTSGANISVTIKEDSLTNAVNSVQASLGYDASQLQFLGLTETGPFSFVAATDTSTPGMIRVARAIPQGNQPVTGDQSVVTVNFKVLAASGTIALNFDENSSLLVRSSDSTNILAATAGATLTVGSAQTQSANMTLTPATANVAPNDTFTVTLKENSGSALVNSVQASVAFDPAKVQFLSITEGNTFPNQAATDTATPGMVRIARSVQVGSGGVTGENTVVTLSFKLLATSGSASLAIEKAASFVVTSADNKDILSTVSGSTITATTTSPSGGATLSMTPSSGSFANGSTVAVTIKANSATNPLTTIQSVVSYPVSQLEYVSTTEGGVFPTAQRTRVADGTVDIIRGVSGGSAGVTGENPVVTLNFKVIGSSGTAPLAFTNASAIYDKSGTGISVLDLAGSTGASYTISGTSAACTANPSTPGAPSRTTFTYTSISMSWTASNPAPGCTMGGYHVLRNGAKVADVTGGTTFTDSGLTAGATYTYTLQAFDTLGHLSAVSSAASLQTRADDVAPTMPAGVTATATSAANVAISWTASSDMPNPGGSGVAGYYIYRNNSTTPTYTVTSGTTYNDTDVAASSSYSYSVAAYDNKGNIGSPSNIVTAQTPAPTCSGTPTAPGNLGSSNTTLTGVTLSWTPSSAGAGCQLAGYKVYRGQQQIATVTSTTFTDNGLEPNTIYEYSVRAYDTSAHHSAASNILTVVTLPDNAAPTTPQTATAEAVSSGRIDLAWTAAADNIAVTGYRVYRNGSLYRSLTADARTMSDTQVTAATDYTYQVSAVDAAGNESLKKTASPNPVRTPEATDTQAPSAPTNLRSLATTTSSVSIAWNASTDNTAVTGYHIYRNGQFVADTSGLTYLDSGLADNTTYTYTVKAFDAGGNTSANSNSLAVKTLQKPVTVLIGDLNADGVVNILDLSILLKNWHHVDVPPQSGELNNDGRVDIFDLSILLSHYGEVA